MLHYPVVQVYTFPARAWCVLVLHLVTLVHKMSQCRLQYNANVYHHHVYCWFIRLLLVFSNSDMLWGLHAQRLIM